ncbi:hypothetical protein [Pseudodesulfovibrio indicus]|uniref:PEP-CTERM sorting domain-containing protein n=1 Tax=Pseudodesulfovibrio indicus TaxID=1716143 RepID=A0A140D904_9BACT|nr:hypothetical protein [Pseudodesulfovibrio indicus]AMK09671.1 hypothetical protein AWY79_00380 [Pseudodesulfovibrio indicus]TDT86376.1 hypothetical protein EDC59_11352 [Pseudodesulfovibrio indicus]
MPKKGLILTVLAAAVLLAANALAESRVLTFDGDGWGTGVWGAYNTTIRMEPSGGNPGACVRFHGIGGLGGSFANQGVTGDLAAAGFTRLSMDIKAVQWFLRPDNTRPKGFFFIRNDSGAAPWVKAIPLFAPTTAAYKTCFVNFNPAWTDAQARADGWTAMAFPGTIGTVSFAETLRRVAQTGFWVQDLSAGAECSVLVDNWTLGTRTAMMPMKKDMKMDPKRRIQPFPGVPNKQ